MSNELVRCKNCGAPVPLDSLGVSISELSEAAVLTCPVCDTSFDLKAVVTKRGGEEEEELTPPETEGPRGPEAPTGAPTGMPELGGEGGMEIEGGAAESIQRVPVYDLPLVLSCKKCKHEWLATTVGPCPLCESREISKSDSEVEDLVASLFSRVADGEEADAAVAKMFGEPLTEAVNGEWEGTLDDFERKLQSLLSRELGLGDGDLVADVIKGLQSPDRQGRKGISVRKDNSTGDETFVVCRNKLKSVVRSMVKRAIGTTALSPDERQSVDRALCRYF